MYLANKPKSPEFHMIYKEYKKASQRHFGTCDFLLREIKDPMNTMDIHLQKKILANIYYLSGYMIECGLSYAFFSVINYDAAKSVYDLDSNNSFGYTFEDYIRKHGYTYNDRKIQVILARGGQKASEIERITKLAPNEPLLHQMYNSWNTKARYTTQHLAFDLNRNNVEEFFNLAKEVRKTALKI